MVSHEGLRAAQILPPVDVFAGEPPPTRECGLPLCELCKAQYGSCRSCNGTGTVVPQSLIDTANALDALRSRENLDAAMFGRRQ